jgi:hypothetical protein
MILIDFLSLVGETQPAAPIGPPGSPSPDVLKALAELSSPPTGSWLTPTGLTAIAALLTEFAKD